MASTKIKMLCIAFLFMLDQNVCFKLYIQYSQYSIIYYLLQTSESAGNWMAEPPADEPAVDTEGRNPHSG